MSSFYAKAGVEPSTFDDLVLSTKDSNPRVSFFDFHLSHLDIACIKLDNGGSAFFVGDTAVSSNFVMGDSIPVGMSFVDRVLPTLLDDGGRLSHYDSWLNSILQNKIRESKEDIEEVNRQFYELPVHLHLGKKASDRMVK